MAYPALSEGGRKTLPIMIPAQIRKLWISSLDSVTLRYLLYVPLPIHKSATEEERPQEYAHCQLAPEIYMWQSSVTKPHL